MQAFLYHAIDDILDSMSKLKSQDAGSLEERVHAYRKSGKRVRAYLKLSNDERASEIRSVRRRIAEVARTLSTLRDRHVAMRTMGNIQAESMSDFESWKILSQDFIHFETTRLLQEEASMQTALSKACSCIDEVRHDLSKLQCTWKPRQAIQAFVKSYRKGRKRTSEILSQAPDVERFHELRKATKQWGYQATWLLQENWVPESDLMRTMVARCDSLGDQLGEGLDLIRLAEQLGEWRSGETGNSLSMQIQSAGMKRLIASVALASQFYFASHKSFRRSLADETMGKEGN
jgi:CHAD domain-containing protein